MAIKRRFNELQDLVVQPVQNEFTGPVSPYFTISELPNPVPQGKSSFLIDGADELLEDGYDVLFEIITQNEDGDDVTIYTEAVANYIEGRSRRVSIEVYEETPPGPATLVILAVASHIKRNPNSPPQRPTKFEFGARGRPKRRKKRGKKRRFRRLREGDRFFREYNIRQEVEILINPTSTNTEPIFFYQEPRIRVREVFKPFITNLTSASILTVSGASIAGNVVEQNQSTTTPPLPFGTSLRKGKKKRRNRKFAMKGGFGRRGFLSRRSSPEPETYTFTSPLFNLSSRYAGGTLELDSPSVDTSKFTLESYHIVPPTASFEIVDVKNSSTLIPDEPFKVYNTQTQAYEIAPITPASFSIKFQPEVTESVSLTNFKSYADVRVSNIRTFSGDVFRTKVYRKSEVNAGDFEIFADLPLESSELLLNSQSPTGLERTGYFVTQSDVVNFYDIHYGRFGSEFKSTDLTESGSSYNNDIKTDSVRISGSNFEFDKAITFELTGSHSFRIDNAVEYDIGFTAYGIQKKKQVKTDTGIVEKQQARMSVFLSGSAIELDNTHNGMFGQSQNDPFFGKYLGSLVVDGSSEKDFGVVKVDYEGKTAGDSVIKFRVEAGEFYLSDISIRPATETGFSPDLFTFEVPMPDGEARPDTFEFLAEFYDVNSNTADAIAFTTGSQFSGSNMVITGTDNVMESNLFIGGESTASGMHLGGVSSQLPEGGPGAVGSAFMRSVGYTGFTSASRISLADPGDLGVGKAGFMFYSGSVLPNSGDNYTGVGLELVGQSGSLRFSTSPSRFEVQADAFFVGRQNIQFISGAAGNIEISSSGIHLTPEGSVTASSIILGNKSDGQFLQFNDGQLTVQGNISVDSILTPALIDGNPSTITNASASITAQGLAKFVSASIGGLDVDSVGISSKSKNLILSQSGQITGSTVLFDGGKIGGFDIKGTGTDVVEGIASSDGSLILSGSGQITGSNVSFIGGKIGGWTLSGGQISAENLILRSEGVIKSANYVSDTAGFIITHEQDGFAEFGNARIRGTMATTTFEKESVNAVGGQLFVANSAALTGSAINTTVASMSLVNVTGFKAGEVIIIKKVSDTGFNTEYVSVVSSSLQGSGSEDLSGNLFVKRGLGFYTRPQVTYVGDESQDSAPTHGQYTISGNTDIVLKHTNITGGDTFNSQGGGSGGLNGFDFGDFRAKTVSESFNVHFSASVSSAGGMTAVDVRLLNNDDSDSLIGSRRVWNSADGAGQIDKHLNYPIGALNPNPSGSRIKVSVRLTNPGANGRFMRPSASFDYGYEGTVQLGESGSVGDPIGGPSTYEPGQVVVSSGRVGTGYIRLNANPNNLATPYIDIVERTGSDIYDVELKARIGDLSGVAGTRNVPSNFDGFGLMSEVAFLSGSNIKLEAPSFLLGDLNANFISGSNSNIEISSSKFHIKQDGDVIVRKVDAEEGSIGGFTINQVGGGQLRSPSGNFIVSGTAGIMELGGGIGDAANRLIKMDARSSVDGKSGNEVVRLSIGNQNPLSAPFQVNAAGSVTASSVSMSGVVTATAGNIAGFQISGTKLQQGTSFHLDGDASANFFISSSNFAVTPAGEVSASSAVFTGNAQAEVFEFTQLSIDSNNVDDYFTSYSGSDYHGTANGRHYSKLDLSGLNVASKTFVRIGVRARNPIGHIEPPRGANDTVSIFYFVFSGGTTGTEQQNLVWSFSGTSGHNARVNNSNMTGTSAAREKYRATDGAQGKGSILFFDEDFDKFRGIAYKKRCLVANANNRSNANPQPNMQDYTDTGSGGPRYEMAHQVDKDVVYTFMCKRGRWYLMDMSNTAVGAGQDLMMSLTDMNSAKGYQVNLLKTTNIVHNPARGEMVHTGDYATTGSATSTPQFHLNKGGSLAMVGEESFHGWNVDSFLQYNINADSNTGIGQVGWTTRRGTDINDRQSLAMTKVRNISQISNYGHSSFDYDRYVDIYQFHKEDHSTGFRWSVGHRSGSADIWIEMGGGTTTELNAGTSIPAPGTADSAPFNQGVNSIMMFPLSGSIMASGGTTSHSNLFYTRADAIAISNNQSETGVTINPIVAGIANGKGFRMIRAGSVTGMSLQLDAVNNSGAADPPPANADVFVRVYKNGSSLCSGATIQDMNSNTDFGAASSFIPNTHTFSGGDNLTVELRISSDNTGHTMDIEHIAVMIEIQTNPAKMNSSDVWNFDS